MQRIRIAVGDVNLDGELNETDAARVVARALPLTAEFQVWGDELYVDIEVDESPRGRPNTTVALGDLGLSVEAGKLFFFCGPSPLSPAEAPVPPVPVTVVGNVRGVEALRAKKDAGTLTLIGLNGDGEAHG
jgi:hypothetical protein